MPAVQLTGNQVSTALSRWGLSTYRMLDTLYWSVDLAYWDTILAQMPPTPRYWPEVFDCDDIAEWFREECSRRFHIKPGIVVNDAHAFNVAVLSDGTLQLIDPMWSDGWVSQAGYVVPGSSLHDLAGARVWI